MKAWLFQTKKFFVALLLSKDLLRFKSRKGIEVVHRPDEGITTVFLDFLVIFLRIDWRW